MFRIDQCCLICSGGDGGGGGVFAVVTIESALTQYHGWSVNTSEIYK